MKLELELPDFIFEQMKQRNPETYEELGEAGVVFSLVLLGTQSLFSLAPFDTQIREWVREQFPSLHAEVEKEMGR